jgi:hypothetical protein
MSTSKPYAAATVRTFSTTAFKGKSSERNAPSSMTNVNPSTAATSHRKAR